MMEGEEGGREGGREGEWSWQTRSVEEFLEKSKQKGLS